MSAVISRKGAIIVAIIAATATILAAIIGKWSGDIQRLPPPTGQYKYVGKVFDKLTGNNIRGAKISLERNGEVPAVVFTDSEGVFSFPLGDVKKEIHLRIEVIGYEKFDLSVVPSNIDGIQVFPLQSTPSPNTEPSSSSNQKGRTSTPPNGSDPDRETGSAVQPEAKVLVSGTVIDVENNRPISDARVNVEGYGGEAVTTTSDGVFSLATHARAGQMFWLQATRDGYVPKKIMHQAGSQEATIRLSKR